VKSELSLALILKFKNFRIRFEWQASLCILLIGKKFNKLYSKGRLAPVPKHLAMFHAPVALLFRNISWYPLDKNGVGRRAGLTVLKRNSCAPAGIETVPSNN
jgi:hypothetical protein